MSAIITHCRKSSRTENLVCLFPSCLTLSNPFTGELELTFINDSCRSANLVACLFNGSVPEALKELWPAFQHAFRADIQGTRINDILGFSNKVQLHLRHASANGRQAKQDEQYLPFAMQHLKT